MGHNPSRQSLIRAARQRAQEDERHSAPRRRAARHVIATWNAHVASGWRPMFFPMVGTALLAGSPWLHVVCPACNIVGEVDLATIDIHPDASIATLVRAMSCKRCCPHPPFARALGITPRPWSGLYEVSSEEVRSFFRFRAAHPVMRDIARQRAGLPADEGENIGWGQQQILNRRGR